MGRGGSWSIWTLCRVDLEGEKAKKGQHRWPPNESINLQKTEKGNSDRKKKENGEKGGKKMGGGRVIVTSQGHFTKGHGPVLIGQSVQGPNWRLGVDQEVLGKKRANEKVVVGHWGGSHWDPYPNKQIRKEE